ncbi:MAG TPA: sugar ABC transporter ATP-binding protein [Candidatus Limnocylindrales bacterium]|nr:sugar ABC transporter ATP-binding protein [Candidatus Limnocylindrales bacterium]
MRGITKSFGGVAVLKEVDFDLRPGEIHALAGGNGAGKSTLMKILVGVYERDGGTYEVDGQRVDFHSVQEARTAGVGMVFQEFSLVPTLSVAQNVFLTREPRTRGGLINDGEMERRTRELFATMSVEVDPRPSLDEVPTALWQLTEIAKALSQDARILIMDEPTAALAKAETVELFTLMRRLKEQGISIVYISHRMEEIFEICDRITVLRDGGRVMTERLADVTPQAVIDTIVGRKLEHTLEYREREIGTEVMLEARGLATANKLRGIDFALHTGEVLGLAGLMGSGRTELARALFGIDALESGDVLVRGRPVAIANPRDAIDNGIALIPEDRRAQGLILEHAVRENLLLPLLSRISHVGFVDDAEGDRRTQAYVKLLSIMARSTSQPTGTLSGGNQQKVVIAKWLGVGPHILIMDEPTAGVDIGTKGEIVNLIRDFANQGNSVILISSELPELLAVSDRILILRDGRVEGEIDRGTIHREEDLHHAIQGVGVHR